jgi:hypothetical protein
MAEQSKDKGTLTEEQKEIVREIAKQAKELGIDPRFAVALANLESSFRHVPADDKTSTAYGPFQVNKATAEANGVDYKAMQEDPKLAIRTGLMNIVRHANNPDLGGDPIRIAAAHRYGENSEFAKTGNPKGIDPTLRDYLVGVTHHFPENKLPEAVFNVSNMEPVVADLSTAHKPEAESNEIPPPPQTMPLPVQSVLTGAVGAAAGPVTAVAHPVAAWAVDKVMNRGGEKQLPPETASEWRPTTSAQTTQTTPEEAFTRGEKQRLGVGDKSDMTGRESQTGFNEPSAQHAARRRVQGRTAAQTGFDVDIPFAEYPDVASTRSGVLVTQEELARQQAEMMRQRQLAEARARVAQQLAAKNAQRVGQQAQEMFASGQTWKPSLATRTKEMVGKMVGNMSPMSKGFAGTLGRVGYGAGAALPYSVELYQHDYPKTAVALPVAAGAAANYFPKTFGGLSALAALMSAGYAAAHPREFSSGLTPHDINPTAFIGMPEESEAAFPEYRGR